MGNSSLLSKFEVHYDKKTELGEESLRNSLREQSIFQNLENSQNAITEIINCIEVFALASGVKIYGEKEFMDKYLYFILKGKCRGLRKNNTVAILGAGECFGEFPILDDRQNYNVSAIAEGDSCFGKVKEKDLINIANKHPKIWKNMARMLAERLRIMNNKFYSKPLNKVPRLFIGSSSEALVVAQTLNKLLNSEHLETKLWSNSFDNLGESYLERLEAISEEFDFGVFVFNDDDYLVSRNEEMKSTRDNVIFELGMFVGKLNRKRAFILWPESKNVKLPSDFNGIIVAKYESKTEDTDSSLETRLKSACDKIRATISETNLAQRV